MSPKPDLRKSSHQTTVDRSTKQPISKTLFQFITAHHHSPPFPSTPPKLQQCPPASASPISRGPSSTSDPAQFKPNTQQSQSPTSHHQTPVRQTLHRPAQQTRARCRNRSKPERSSVTCRPRTARLLGRNRSSRGSWAWWGPGSKTQLWNYSRRLTLLSN